MLHANLGCNANLLWGSAHELGETTSSHGARYTNLSLAADLSARDGSVHLVQGSNLVAGEDVISKHLGGNGLNELVVVSQYCRDNAAGAVRRCGDNAAAGCILFRDSQCEHIDPAEDV